MSKQKVNGKKANGKGNLLFIPGGCGVGETLSIEYVLKVFAPSFTCRPT